MPEVPRPALLDGSFHHHLLRDSVRLKAYADAIGRIVHEGDVVVDVGSGSGILAWLAVQAGARKVHAVEANSHSYKALLRMVRLNEVTGQVVPVLSDGTEWRPKEPVDVVICELMETGLLHEPIAAVMRNVRSWEPTPRAILPREVRLFVEGVELQDSFLGYRAVYSGFRALGEEDPPLTERVAYATYDFEREAPPEELQADFELRVVRDGRLGGIQLRTQTLVAPGLLLGESPAYCSPVALTLEEPLEVREGERLRGRLQYEFSYTAKPLAFTLERA